MKRKKESSAEAPPAPSGSAESSIERWVESAVLRSVFPSGTARRELLRTLGAGAVLSSISSFLPLGAAKSFAVESSGPLEKKVLAIGFVPITCATPIIMADPMGFYSREGLKVSLVKTAGWALVRDKLLNREYDASHMLSPMPLAISLGIGSRQDPTYVAAIENINGQAITLHSKHKDKRDPKQWKGMKFAVPFDYSMHNLLLRYYVGEHGLDPDRDIEIRVVPPPEMVANLRAGNIDGYLGPEPFNQRAVYEEVGFIHLLSKEIWDGHPCCAFGVRDDFIKQNPNTFAALFRAIARATAFAHKEENRKQIAQAIAPANYLNQPIAVVEQVLTGRFADGLGQIRNVPGRADFDPFPWPSVAVWILTRLRVAVAPRRGARRLAISHRFSRRPSHRRRRVSLDGRRAKIRASHPDAAGADQLGAAARSVSECRRERQGDRDSARLLDRPRAAGVCAGDAHRRSLGFLIGTSPLLSRALNPYIQLLMPISPLAWMPLALYTIRDSSLSSIFVITICSVWPMLINTAHGVSSVKREWLNVARTHEAYGLRRALQVVLPAAAPTILTGMRISMGIAWLVIVAAEMLVGGTGIGTFVWNEWNNLSLSNVVFALLLIGLVGMLLDLAFGSLTRLVSYQE